MADFVEWKGGDCPVDPDTRVYVKYRDGIEAKIRIAGELRWVHADLPDDIVGYETATDRHAGTSA